MHVVATAGHVDHGKSSLVRYLTGTDPDRLAEEKRRGLTIDLGFAWMTLRAGRADHQVAFVDVPGHERFVTTMLAGVGPVGVVMFVVAADGGWMPQSAEHLSALAALGVRRGLLVVTRCDLADPGPAMAVAREQLARTAMAEVPAVAFSSLTGEGISQLRETLAGVLATVPEPKPGPVRLWVDRSFSIRGAGTVVTGTLPAGSVSAEDTLELLHDGHRRSVRVRGLQSLDSPVQRADAVARVAINLRGLDRCEVGRADVLLTPGCFVDAGTVDVRVPGVAAADLPSELVAHLGTAAVGARVRPLGGHSARLQLQRVLPLHIGDRLLLREPARHLVLGAAVVLDVRPPALSRRGAAAVRAGELAGLSGRPEENSELRRRGLVRTGELTAMGVTARSAPVTADWHADPVAWQQFRDRVAEVVREYRRAHPLQPGPTLEEVRQACRLPDRALVEALIAPPLQLQQGRVVPAEVALPPDVERAVRSIRTDLASDPFAAPDADRLRGLGLGRAELAAAARAGALLLICEGVVLGPGALPEAARRLAELPQPFTVSAARQCLATSRRVALPLLLALDRAGLTRRGADDRRAVQVPAP